MIFTKNADNLDREKVWAPVGLVLLSGVLVSGLLIWLFPDHNGGRQVVILLHVLAGIAITFMLLPYVAVHFQRTAFFRRPSLLVTGVMLCAVLLGLLGSGWYMTIAGQQESLAYVPNLHRYLAAATISILILHLADHVLRMPVRRKAQYPAFLSLTTSNLFVPGVLIFIVPLIFVAGQQLLNFAPEPASPAVADYAMPYGNHPFRPSQTETSHGSFVAASEIGGSETCADCHAQIAKDWAASVHRQAASDPTYVTNVNLLESNKGIEATRYCEGCHAPVALLTGELSAGGLHGGKTGTPANLEGVSCMSCHGVSRMVHLKGVASYEFTPRQQYLFDAVENPVLAGINRLLIRADPDQHRADMGRALLSDAGFCAGCHAQFMDKDINNWGWVKMQDDYSAWLASPFSGHENAFSEGKPVTCIDCHMPKVLAEDPSADVDGKVRSHYFPGGNTFLSLLAGNQARFEETVRFLQANRLRLTINKPNREDSRQDLRPIDEAIRGFEEAPFYAYLGDEVSLDIIVTNRGVGHDFPAGTIDLGEAWIDFEVQDAQGDIVFQRQYPDAHVYKSTPVGRDGREVWRHDLFNMIGESFRRVIPAGESDLVQYRFDIPAWAISPLTVSATLKYRKLNERYARFGLGEKYFTIPAVDMAWDSLQVPLRYRREVENISTGG